MVCIGMGGMSILLIMLSVMVTLEIHFRYIRLDDAPLVTSFLRSFNLSSFQNVPIAYIMCLLIVLFIGRGIFHLELSFL